MTTGAGIPYPTRREDNGLIQEVRLLPRKTRRKGTFSEDVVAAVVFAGGGADA